MTTVQAGQAVTITHQWDWPYFERALRSVSLLGDPQLKPYQAARISTRTVDPNHIAPLSRYVLKSQLSKQRQLAEHFIQEQALDIFDLPGAATTVEYTIGDTTPWLLSPPIVEVSRVDGDKAVLVDGEHRLYLARQLKRLVTVVWIEEVPEIFPVVAFPLSWHDVQEYKAVPPTAEKRAYRFPTVTDFPDIASFSRVMPMAETVQYFFYRDLSPICSSGIRK